MRSPPESPCDRCSHFIIGKFKSFQKRSLLVKTKEAREGLPGICDGAAPNGGSQPLKINKAERSMINFVY